jgi:hypothetical protein
MTKKLISAIATTLGLFGAQSQAATGHDSVYLRDSEQGSVELSNVPAGKGYKHLLDATVPTTPQAPVAAQPVARPAQQPAAPVAEAGSADPAAADSKDDEKDKDKDTLADGTEPPYTGGYSGAGSAGGGSSGGGAGGQPVVTVPRVTPGTDVNAALASMSQPIDPALATQLQQYRALMLQQANPATGYVGNPAKSRRYLMMDRATYQATIGK